MRTISSAIDANSPGSPSRLGKGMPYGIHLVCVNPDYLDAALARIQQGDDRNPYVIGCWFWELETIPEEWRDAVDKVDEILVASSFVEKASSTPTGASFTGVTLIVTVTV